MKNKLTEDKSSLFHSKAEIERTKKEDEIIKKHRKRKRSECESKRTIE